MPYVNITQHLTLNLHQICIHIASLPLTIVLAGHLLEELAWSLHRQLREREREKEEQYYRLIYSACT